MTLDELEGALPNALLHAEPSWLPDADRGRDPIDATAVDGVR